MAQYRPDIIITDQFGATLAIIQVKSFTGVDVKNASQYMRNLLAHGVVPSARFTMLVTADTGYLWGAPAAVVREAAPLLLFPIDPILRHFLPGRDFQRPIGGDFLETITRFWLEDLTDGRAVDDQVDSSLRDAGFLQAVCKSQVSERVYA